MKARPRAASTLWQRDSLWLQCRAAMVPAVARCEACWYERNRVKGWRRIYGVVSICANAGYAEEAVQRGPCLRGEEGERGE
eukprot:2925675-Prymnesium_polylepis.1